MDQKLSISAGSISFVIAATYEPPTSTKQRHSLNSSVCANKKYTLIEEIVHQCFGDLVFQICRTSALVRDPRIMFCSITPRLYATKWRGLIDLLIKESASISTAISPIASSQWV